MNDRYTYMSSECKDGGREGWITRKLGVYSKNIFAGLKTKGGSERREGNTRCNRKRNI